MSWRIREEEEEGRKGSGEEESLGEEEEEHVEERCALAVGDALQVGEDVLDLLQPLPEAGHGQDRELVARVDGQHGQEPPAAGGTVGGRLEKEEEEEEEEKVLGSVHKTYTKAQLSRVLFN